MKNNLPRTSWRLLISDPQPGKWNMGIDSAILEAVQLGKAPTTLRLYAWSPPCLSLGYNQPYSDIDLRKLESCGWDIVRRPTGGRAILHTDELTYSVVGPKNDPHLSGGLHTSYQQISRALHQALLNLGLPAEIHAGKNPLAHQQPVCFENPSDFEITVDGKKIIGSAQARKKDGILQHGSLPLFGDLARITDVLAYPSEDIRSESRRILLEKATTVSDILKTSINWDQAALAFRDAFTSILNLELQEGSLTTWEKERARDLADNKYGSHDWTLGNQNSLNR